MDRNKFVKGMLEVLHFSKDENMNNIKTIKKWNNLSDEKCHSEMNGETLVNMVAIGELAELQEVLTKEYRGEAGHYDILEEIADVYIVLEELKMAYGISGYEIEKAIAIKTNRCLARTVNNPIEEVIRLRKGGNDG